MTSIINNVVINNDQIQINCDDCPQDYYGKNDGICCNCGGPLQYSHGGAKKCEECKQGSFPRRIGIYFFV